MADFINEMKWRGMIHDLMPGTQELLSGSPVAGYIGFDPTADSLHIGNLVQIMTLVHFQRCGHKPVVLVGGATGMVGDPSGKSEERNLLSEDILNHNLVRVKEQLSKFLDFENGQNKAEMVNNYDWFKDYHFLDFIRDIGKHITVNYMLSKDSVKTRLESGMSFTEFSYQLVQGYDFLWLYEHLNCKLQLGGSDQWGNIVTGTELIRRKLGGEAYAMTTPLIKKADGSKFGKTEGGNIWLDKNRTTPYKFYQYWLNASDEDVKNFIRIFTLLSFDEIQDLEKEHDDAPHLRILQNRLAEDITERVHSKEDLVMAKKASSILFGKSTKEDLVELDEPTFLSVFDGVPKISVSTDKLSSEITSLLSEGVDGQIFSSKGEARRMISGGGVSINKEKISLGNHPGPIELIKGRYVLVQKGKKNYYLLMVGE